MLNEVDLSILHMLVVFIACSEMRSKLYSNAAKSVRLCSPATCVQQNAVIDVAMYFSLMFHSVTSHLQTTKEKKKKETAGLDGSTRLCVRSVHNRESLHRSTRFTLRYNSLFWGHALSPFSNTLRLLFFSIAIHLTRLHLKKKNNLCVKNKTLYDDKNNKGFPE